MSTAPAFSRLIEVFVTETLSPEALSARLAAVAHETVDGLVRSGEVPPAYTSFVDGRRGAPFESVKADGVILLKFNPFPAVVTYALEFLKQRSPEKTGRYRRGFYLGITREGRAGGKFVEADAYNPAAVTSDVVEVVIGNVEPYSRKIDVQYIGRKKLNFSVPPGLFDDAAKMISARYKGMVVAKRVYTMEYPGKYILHSSGKPVESPALVVALPGAFIGSKPAASATRVGTKTRRIAAKPGRETAGRRSSTGDVRRWNEATKKYDYLRRDPKTGEMRTIG